MDSLRKHVDLVAGALAFGWGTMVALAAAAAPLAEHVSPQAAYAFSLAALARWAYGTR